MDWLEELASYKEDFIRDEHTKVEGAPFGKSCKEALEDMLSLGKLERFVAKDIDGYAGVIEYGNEKESVVVQAHLGTKPIGERWNKAPYGAEHHKWLFVWSAMLSMIKVQACDIMDRFAKSAEVLNYE